MIVTDEIVVGRLRQHSLSITSTCIRILTLIYSLDSPVSTGLIVQASGYVLDRITVYRTLQAFLKEGILQPIPNSNRVSEFILRHEVWDELPHLPQIIFVCEQCCDKRLLPLDALVRRYSVLVGTLHEIVLKGVCKS